MGTGTLTFSPVSPEYLGFMQNYKMLPDQCGLIQVKALPTDAKLDEEEIHVCWSRDWTVPFSTTRTISAFRFQHSGLWKQYVLLCTR